MNATVTAPHAASPHPSGAGVRTSRPAAQTRYPPSRAVGAAKLPTENQYASAASRSCAEAFDELADVVESEDRGDPLAALHAVLTEHARFAFRSPQLYRLMFGAAGPERTGHAELVAAQDRLEAVAAEALQRAAGAGAIAGQDLGDVLLALRSLVHGVIMWALDADLPTDRALAGVEGVLAVMDRGLLPRSARSGAVRG